MSVALEKDGAIQADRPAVYPHVAGSRDAMTVSEKIRALHEAMGADRPIIVRFADDRAAILSAEALKFIPLHEGHSA